METRRVVAYEPRTDLPSGSDPLFAELVTKGRSRILGRLIGLPIFVAFEAVALAYFGDPAIWIPGMVLFVLLWALMAYNWFGMNLYVWRRLGTPYRALTLAAGGLLVKGSKVGFALPDGRWVVSRMSEPERLLLAGLGRVYLLMGEGDRLMVCLPGFLSSRLGRIRTEAPAGWRPLAPPPRGPLAPKDDPVVRAQAGIARRVALIFHGLWVAIVVCALTAGLMLDDSSAAGFFTGLAIGFVLLAMIVTGAAVRLAKAVQATHWTELGIVLDQQIGVTGGVLASSAGRVLLADGREVAIKLPNVTINLLATIQMSGRLWVLGTPRPGKTIRIGLPGFPLTSTARLGRVR